MHDHSALVKHMVETAPDEGTLKNLSSLFKVFGDLTRMRILYALAKKEVCVGDLAAALDKLDHGAGLGRRCDFIGSVAELGGADSSPRFVTADALYHELRYRVERKLARLCVIRTSEQRMSRLVE